MELISSVMEGVVGESSSLGLKTNYLFNYDFTNSFFKDPNNSNSYSLKLNKCNSIGVDDPRG